MSACVTDGGVRLTISLRSDAVRGVGTSEPIRIVRLKQSRAVSLTIYVMSEQV